MNNSIIVSQKVILDKIPEEMKRERRWLVWKEGKIPLNPNAVAKRWRNQSGKSTDPDTWADFDTAVECLHTFPYVKGLGFVLGDGWAGVDWDDCLYSSGDLKEEFKSDVSLMNTYTEVSPSGTGLKGILKATIKLNRCRHNSREAYTEQRYFTVTGRHWSGTPLTVESRQSELEEFCKRHFPAGRAHFSLPEFLVGP